jgi:hypothetical protein
LISIFNTQAKAETIKTIRTGCIGGEPSLRDMVMFTDKIGNNLQMDAQLLYEGLVELAKFRQVSVVDYVTKLSKGIEGDVE